MKDAASPSSCTLDHTSNAFRTGPCGRPPSVAVRQARVALPPTRSSLGHTSQWLAPSPGAHTRLYLGQTWARETQQAGGRAWGGSEVMGHQPLAGQDSEPWGFSHLHAKWSDQRALSVPCRHLRSCPLWESGKDHQAMGQQRSGCG